MDKATVILKEAFNTDLKISPNTTDGVLIIKATGEFKLPVGNLNRIYNILNYFDKITIKFKNGNVTLKEKCGKIKVKAPNGKYEILEIK